jgi:glutathione S-transferase
MLLYNSQVSGNCYKVRLLFAHLGIEYERQELSVVDRSNRPDVLGELNPAQRVPTLVLDDGRAMSESNAIVNYFAEGTPYLPEDRFERSQVLQWQFFEQYDHEPNIAVARFLVAFSGTNPSESDLEPRYRGGYRALDAMEGHLADHQFLVGERYTIADLGVYAYVHVAGDATLDLADYPAVSAWIARVEGTPGFVDDLRPIPPDTRFGAGRSIYG